MKAKRKEEGKWVPIVITLESKEEAQYFWHCANAYHKDIEDVWEDADIVPFPSKDVSEDLYEVMDKFRNLLKESN